MKVQKKNVANIMNYELVIFTKKECEKFAILIKKLEEKHITYREINADNRNRFYDYFWSRLRKDGFAQQTINVPVVVLNGNLEYLIKDVAVILKKITTFNTAKK